MYDLTLTPEQIEFRDDRVLIFTSATKAARSFRYALRAITAGLGMP